MPNISPQTNLAIAGPILPYPHPRTIKATADTMGTRVSKGDKIDTGNGGGYFVVLQDHFLGQAAMLPGQSNDHLHWAVGPSTAGLV